MPDFRAANGRNPQKLRTGVVNVLLAHKRTLREVLLAAAEFRHLLNQALAVYVEDAGETVTIREELVVYAGTPTKQAIELAVGILARHSSALLGNYWKPRAVHFTHRGPADLTFHRRFFGCPMEFGSDFNGFVCAAAELDFPNPTADPELVRYADKPRRSTQRDPCGSRPRWRCARRSTCCYPSSKPQSSWSPVICV